MMNTDYKLQQPEHVSCVGCASHREKESHATFIAHLCAYITFIDVENKKKKHNILEIYVWRSARTIVQMWEIDVETESTSEAWVWCTYVRRERIVQSMRLFGVRSCTIKTKRRKRDKQI